MIVTDRRAAWYERAAQYIGEHHPRILGVALGNDGWAVVYGFYTIKAMTCKEVVERFWDTTIR